MKDWLLKAANLEILIYEDKLSETDPNYDDFF